MAVVACGIRAAKWRSCFWYSFLFYVRTLCMRCGLVLPTRRVFESVSDCSRILLHGKVSSLGRLPIVLLCDVLVGFLSRTVGWSVFSVSGLPEYVRMLCTVVLPRSCRSLCTSRCYPPLPVRALVRAWWSTMGVVRICLARVLPLYRFVVACHSSRTTRGCH